MIKLTDILLELFDTFVSKTVALDFKLVISVSLTVVLLFKLDISPSFVVFLASLELL
jgi:hypothetical protein